MLQGSLSCRLKLKCSRQGKLLPFGSRRESCYHSEVIEIDKLSLQGPTEKVQGPAARCAACVCLRCAVLAARNSTKKAIVLTCTLCSLHKAAQMNAYKNPTSTQESSNEWSTCVQISLLWRLPKSSRIYQCSRHQAVNSCDEGCGRCGQ